MLDKIDKSLYNKAKALDKALIKPWENRRMSFICGNMIIEFFLCKVKGNLAFFLIIKMEGEMPIDLRED